MAGVAHVAVHVVAPVDTERLEEAGDGRGRGDGLGDGRVHQSASAEDRAFGAVQIDRGNQQAARTIAEAIGQPLGLERLAHVGFQRAQGKEPGGHVAGAPGQDVRPFQAELGDGFPANGPDELEEVPGCTGEGALVVDGPSVKVEGIVPLLVQDLVEVERANLVGHQRADDGTGAGADVQVERVGAEAR